MPRLPLAPALGLALAAAGAAFTPAPTGDDLHAKVLAAIAAFKRDDPGLERFFAGSVGYAVFPGVGKGAIGIGGAHGTGEVFAGGRVIGTTSLTQVTIGLQLGGQAYREVIFFETPAALESLTRGHLQLSAQVSAVAAAEGAAATAKYRDGVAVFTRAKGGLMYEASVGGQKFSFKPLR